LVAVTAINSIGVIIATDKVEVDNNKEEDSIRENKDIDMDNFALDYI
jgi:hypothetical protein